MHEDDELANERRRIRQMPVFLKAMEIAEIAHRLHEFMHDELKRRLTDDDLDLANEYLSQIYVNALMLAPKISGAEAAFYYDLKMENAALIRRAAREIGVNCSAMRMFDLGGNDYFDMMHDEIEEFRVEFAQWVQTFNQQNYTIDRWGLFNPPGVNYDDIDPDDDIPFDINDYDDSDE